MSLPYLCVGARFTVEQTPVEIVGSLWYDEDGFRWTSHRLTGLGADTWLDVEDDEFSLWTPRPDLAGIQPGAFKLEIDGRTFSQDEDGVANFEVQGDTGTSPAGRYEYVDYSCPDGTLLSFERYEGGAWEVSEGRELNDEALAG